MVDRIVVLNETEGLVVFTDRPPIKVSSGDAPILHFLRWFLAPSVHYPLSYLEYSAAIFEESENTVDISLQSVG